MNDEPVDPNAVSPSRELSLSRRDRPPVPVPAAGRLPARHRISRVVPTVAAGPLLGAVALAVVAAATGKAIEIITGAARPTNARAPKPMRPGAPPSAARADVQVIWTSVQIRWTSSGWPGEPAS